MPQADADPPQRGLTVLLQFCGARMESTSLSGLVRAWHKESATFLPSASLLTRWGGKGSRVSLAFLVLLKLIMVSSDCHLLNKPVWAISTWSKLKLSARSRASSRSQGQVGCRPWLPSSCRAQRQRKGQTASRGGDGLGKQKADYQGIRQRDKKWT